MKLINGVPLLHLIFLAWCPLAFQARSASVGRSTYIVHMDKSHMPKIFPSHHHWYSSTVDSIKLASHTTSNGHQSKPELVYSYDNALHGFSALLSQDELETLRNSPGFVSAYSDREISLNTTHSTEFLSLNPVTGLWPASDYGVWPESKSFKDVIIGVIDSGVWPESKSFNDKGMSPIPSMWKGKCEEGREYNSSLCNLKLIGARSFNKGFSCRSEHHNPHEFCKGHRWPWHAHGLHSRWKHCGRRFVLWLCTRDSERGCARCSAGHL